MKKRRAVELLAVCPDSRGVDGHAIAITVAVKKGGMLREVFPHGARPRDLAGALELAAAWVRAMEALP